MKYETESGRQFTGGEIARLAMHGDAVAGEGKLYVDGERVIPVDKATTNSREPDNEGGLNEDG